MLDLAGGRLFALIVHGRVCPFPLFPVFCDDLRRICDGQSTWARSTCHSIMKPKKSHSARKWNSTPT